MDCGDVTTVNIEILERSALANALSTFRNSNNNTTTCCVDCGEEIPVARRHAVPGCRRCVACQMEHEGNNHE